ncbi:hypothetical protein C7M52_01122 [Mixta theicola]|nr:hypothetical protein [Mixta theicola]QHM75173.1 hypothetical protein C7M52_01122 [Mixta theicola]
MSKELGGYGPTAGDYIGGTGGNLNQQTGKNSSVNWGGGSGNGNSGGQRDTTSSSSLSQQISAIQRDPKIKQKLVGILRAARLMNPAATMILGSISPSGMMAVTIDGINADQAKKVGLVGFIMGVEAPGHIGAVGDIDTGHPLNQSGAIIPESKITVDEFVNGYTPAGGWQVVADNSWAGAGPVDAGLVNNAIRSVQVIRKGHNIIRYRTDPFLHPPVFPEKLFLRTRS